MRPAAWQPLLPQDLPSVKAIADAAHPDLPERLEVLAEKARLFPAGCQKLVSNGKIAGYGISHPWLLNSVPPLDALLRALPQEPQCLYLHDVVVLPEARGAGAAGRYVDSLKLLAAEMRIPALALVSVYGTDALWSRFGFRAVRNAALAHKLFTYGPTAKYMRCDQIRGRRRLMTAAL